MPVCYKLVNTLIVDGRVVEITDRLLQAPVKALELDQSAPVHLSVVLIPRIVLFWT